MKQLKFKRLAIGLGLAVVCQPGSADIHPICRQGDSDIVPVYRQAPQYPHAAWLTCVEGHVVVEFLVDRNGRVQDPFVIESEPPELFDRAALNTIEQWHFQPRCIDGQPVERRASQRIEFEHQGLDESICNTALDDQGAALLTEISTWYALLFAHLVDYATLYGADQLIPDAEHQFSGDLARVAAFHRQFIGTLIEQAPQRLVPPQPVNLFMDPDSFSAPPTPDQVLERLALHRSQYQAQARLRADHYREQQQRFRELRASTRLPNEQLELLVYPFVGGFDEDIDGLYPADAEVLRLLSDVASFLELHQGDWVIKEWAGAPSFEDEILMRELIDRLGALTSHVQEMRDVHGQWTGSFRDYLN